MTEQGCVLSEERIQSLERVYREYHSKVQYGVDVLDLIATIRDRDKKIEERDKTIDELREVYDLQYGAMIQHLKRENEQLREKLDAYERVVEAARHWRETRDGGKWIIKGGQREAMAMYRTRLAREEALIRAVDALESDVE